MTTPLLHGKCALVTGGARGIGLAVARVIAPELCALDVSHRARFLGGERLRSAAFELGLVREPFEVSDLNPLPHPFP